MDNYYEWGAVLMQMMQPIEEIITLVATRRTIPIEEVERIFTLPNQSTRNIIDFLVKFDFLRIVNDRNLTLSESCSPFFEEMLT